MLFKFADNAKLARMKKEERGKMKKDVDRLE